MHCGILFLSSLGESIRHLTDLLEYTAEHEEVGILFSADFDKALTQSNIHLYLPLLNHLDSVHSLFNG